MRIRSKSNWMCINCVHMAQQVSRLEANCDKHGCYQLTRTILKDCSEACPASTAGCGYTCTPKLSTVDNGTIVIIILLSCTTVLSHQKTSLFIPQHCCKGRTERSDVICTTNQANNLVVGITSRESCNKRFECAFNNANTTDPYQIHIWCASRCHCESIFTINLAIAGNPELVFMHTGKYL